MDEFTINMSQQNLVLVSAELGTVLQLSLTQSRVTGGRTVISLKLLPHQKKV